MINKNDALILECIMKLNHCDMVSAMDFAENHVSDYPLAKVVVQAKDEEFKAEKQALIDKACEWLRNEADRYYPNTIFGDTRELVQDFKKAMKGDKQ